MTTGQDPMAMRWRLGVLLLAGLVPWLVFWEGWQNGGWLAFPHFGEVFVESRLPELDALSPPTLSPDGYDGQFYAQMALRPSLADPALAHALDNPSYRARRIGLPLLAAIFGGGDDSRTLAVYSALNFIFWAALAWLLVFRYLDASFRALVAILAILWSSGTLISMERALTDLPAAALGLFAVHRMTHHPTGGAGLMAYSALMKDTSILSMAACWPRLLVGRWPQRIGLALMLLTPVILWALYVLWRMPGGAPTGLNNFSLPGVAWWDKVQTAKTLLFSAEESLSFHVLTSRLIEWCAPICLAVQALYLLLRWRPSEPLWCFGIGFAVLLFVLGPSIWAEFIGYTRILLPLTIAFNLLLLRYQRGVSFWLWLVAGNVGLTGALGSLML